MYPQRHHLPSRMRLFLDFLAAKFADQRAREAENTQVWWRAEWS